MSAAGCLQSPSLKSIPACLDVWAVCQCSTLAPQLLTTSHVQDMYDKQSRKERGYGSDADSDGVVGFGKARSAKSIMTEEQVLQLSPTVVLTSAVLDMSCSARNTSMRLATHLLCASVSQATFGIVTKWSIYRS